MNAILILLLFPFVSVAQVFTHSRAGAMGDAGIAVASGNQQLAYNVGKTVLTPYLHQVSLTYQPWMRQLFHDSKFIRADYLTTIGENTTFGTAIDYLDLGNLTIRDDNGASLAIYRNIQYSVAGSVGVRLAEHAGVGATMRFVSARSFASGPLNRYGVAGDLHYYQSMGKFNLGAVINNIGSDLRQPMEAGIGLGYEAANGDTGNEWNIGIDVRKTVRGLIKGLRYSLGTEYGFNQSFFLRGGLQLERRDQGNRKFISLGAGYKGYIEDQALGVDLFYLVPFGVHAAVSPFQNAWGISLQLSLGNFQ